MQHTGRSTIAGALSKKTGGNNNNGAETEVATLGLMAKNEYGEYDSTSLSIYGLDMVVEVRTPPFS